MWLLALPKPLKGTTSPPKNLSSPKSSARTPLSTTGESKNPLLHLTRRSAPRARISLKPTRVLLGCCNHTLCSNIFRTRDRLIRTLRVRGGSVLHCTPRLRGDANPARLVRSLRSRAKPKNFPSLFLIFGGGCGGSRQKMERKFLVLLRRFRLLKEQYYFNIFVCSFLRPCGETRRFLSVFCGSSKLYNFVH